MNAGMKMLMLSNVNKGKDQEEKRSERYSSRPETNGWETEMAYGRYPMGMEENSPRDEAELRFRDKSGREHYDNGRYAPKSYMGYYPEEPPTYAHMRPEPNRQRPIGFAAYAGEDPSRYESEAIPPRMNEFSHMKNSEKMYGHADGREMSHMTKHTAEEWASKMSNEDGTHGAHWTMDQTKQVMAQKNISADPVEFYIVMNMMYSDYCKVFKKHGVGDKIDFYVDMTKAFLDDKDAYPDKLSRYYECVVK